MRKITLDEAAAGMVLAADIFDRDFDGDLPIICRGVELSDVIISRLRNRGVYELIIATPPGYRGAPGEILAPARVTEDIIFDGAVELHCDVPPETKILAGEDITIHGAVGPECTIRSASGDIVITGTLSGTVNRPIILNAAKRVIINNPSSAPLCALDVRAMGEVAINGDISDSSVAAKGRLRIGGTVIRSKIYSQARIRVDACGNDDDAPCELLVRPQECRPLFQELLGIDKKNAALGQEMQRLQNTIELVRKLGKDIERLPSQNRMQMAVDIKRFWEVQEEIRACLHRKERLKREIGEVLGSNRIIVLRQALPGTRITIENFSRILDETIARTAFFVREMRVEAAPFGECSGGAASP